MAAAAAQAAAPSVTLTTIWPDTAFSGPYNVRTVIKGADGVGYAALAFYFNPTDGPWYWPYYGWGNSDDNWIEEYTQVGDTFYFDIPAVPIGLETPVTVGYSIYAEDNFGNYVENPSPNGYYSFTYKFYSPAYSNVSTLRDTFFTGPFVVRTNLTTAYGDSVVGDYVYSDIEGGNTYFRDSLGADNFYYYSIPRHGGNSQTPIDVSWFMAAYDTMGNWAQYPTKRDTMNHFRIIDPWAYNTSVQANTQSLGPFPVWTSFKSEGGIVNDSLWVFENGTSTWVPYPRDSVSGGVYHFTIPAQQYPVINPVTVTWYIKATDDLTGNYSYQPLTAPLVNNEFRIYDLTPPVVANGTAWPDTSFTGPFTVTATATATSCISKMRLY
jgi:hypothetical protein